MTREVEIEGQRYLCQKISARAQLQIARRLAPVLEGLVPLFHHLNRGNLMPSANGDGALVPGPIDPYEIVASMLKTMAKMPDEDVDYVMNNCLAAVRFQSGDRWAPLMAPGGGLMLRVVEEDLSTHLRLVWEVLAENLTNFSLDRLLGSQSAAMMQTFGLSS
jgi:hypothetical protein